MTDLISNIAAGGPDAAGANAPNVDATAPLSTDFDTFLSLLTAQLKNQDPLQPLDSTQFVAQLASFSTVEQQTATNAKLDELMGLLGGEDAGTAFQWLGAEVAAPGGGLNFTGAPMTIALDPDGAAGADQIEVRLETKDGAPIATLSVQPGVASTTWSGETSAGSIAAPGEYRVSAVAIRGGEAAEAVQALAFVPVADVRLANQGAVLTLADGRQIAATEVAALRAATDPAE